jgi:pyruvate/2-oxoglutarate dehydrogenase complex dihydrolipoamide acyltransferase (E2) component
MKMQILITAPVPGTVTSILCKEGERVEKNAVLALIGQNGFAATYVPEQRDSNKPVAGSDKSA